MKIAQKQSVPIRPCEQCGEMFKPRDNKHRSRFCSKPCASAAMMLKPKTCATCGKRFQPTSSAQRCCGKLCACRWTAKHKKNRKPFLISKRGYKLIYMPDHPQSKPQGGYLFEHRLVMERAFGRLLTTNEVVHHINHVKTDNRLENLQLMLKGDHDKLNLPRQSTLTCPHCQGLIVTSRPVRIVAQS